MGPRRIALTIRSVLVQLAAPLLALGCLGAEAPPAGQSQEAAAIKKVGPPKVKVLRLVAGDHRFQNYPYALPTLLREMDAKTTVKIETEPDLISSFEDPVIFERPFIYANFADRPDWNFTDRERESLRRYLNRGGFIFVDAGISAEFLRGEGRRGQHHSFAEWQATPELAEAFKGVFPGRAFRPLKRSHPLFKAFYQGLPAAEQLPETVREFVVREKWPQGTFSGVVLEVRGRIAVLATPIIAMGWGKNSLGHWNTKIGFRIRETAPGLTDYLKTAPYAGESFEVRREDGALDMVYCQNQAVPAWVREPQGQWRVFRYYHGREISEFAHLFYTQLGTNIMLYALTH